MATATAIAASTILSGEKTEMLRQLHAVPFADRFLTHMLTRNIRIEEECTMSNRSPSFARA